MIEYIAVTNVGKNVRTELPLSNPYETGIAVINVDGLGPSAGTINVTDIAGGDGSVFNSSRLQTKNITLTLEFLHPNKLKKSIEEVRLFTYELFPVKKPIEFEVKTSNRHAKIFGYVESNDPSIFSRSESTEISIICPDPYFYAIDENGSFVEQFDSTKGGFTFAFSNPQGRSELKFSEIISKEEKVISYSGDIPSGLVITVDVHGDVEMLRIAKTNTAEFISIDTSLFNRYGKGKLVSGDKLIINTNNRNKKVKLYRGGKEYNVLHTMSMDSSWINVTPGRNIFAYSTLTGIENLEITLDYNIMYEGV